MAVSFPAFQLTGGTEKQEPCQAIEWLIGTVQ